MRVFVLKYIFLFFLPQLLWSQAFEENKGQLRDDQGQSLDKALYSMEMPGLRVYITDWGLSYVFYKKTSSQVEDEIYVYDWCREDVILEGANIRADRIDKSQPVQGYKNYYLPHCPKGAKEVKAYGELLIKDIYPGIDWLLKSDERPNRSSPVRSALQSLKHEFIVHPGADPSLIKMQYEGAASLKLSADKKILSLKTEVGELKEGELVSFQLAIDNRQLTNHQQPTSRPSTFGSVGRGEQQISSSYQISKNNQVYFQLGNYDKNKTLIIDPPLVWSTYYGGAGSDGPQRIRTDQTGNVYVTGYTSSDNFPLKNPGSGTFYQGTNNSSGAGKDAFVTKFGPGGQMLWATYYGGSSQDEGRDLCTDAAGNVYVVGEASSDDFPLFDPGGGAFMDNINGAISSSDGFVLKFDNAGVLLWGTYLGGTKGWDSANGVAVDKLGNIYVTGATGSTNFPYVDPADGRFMKTYSAGNDAFLCKFTPALILEWATYMGGVRDDVAYAIATDNNNNVFITGATASNSQFPKKDPGLPAFYQGANAVNTIQDAFIFRFDASGTMTWGTFYGGTKNDMGLDIAVSNAGNVFVKGATSSFDFPIYDPGMAWMQSSFKGGSYDAFLLKFTNAGERLWATYIGGNGNDQSAESGTTSSNRTGLAVDNLENVFVVGGTNSGDFPTFDPGGGVYYQGPPLGTITNIYITEFDATNQMVWSTCYGGGFTDWARGATVGPDGCLYVTGEFISNNIKTFDSLGTAFIQSTSAGGHDGFVLKFCPITPNMSASLNTTNVLCKGDSTGIAVVTPFSGSGNYTYYWQPGGFTDSMITDLPAGTYTVTIDDGNTVYVDSVEIKEPVALQMDLLQDQFICSGDQVTLISTVLGGVPDYTYSWNSGASSDSTFTVSPDDTTQYILEVTDVNGCTSKDSLMVFVVPNITAQVSEDTLICFGDSLQLSASGGTSYQWSTGAATNSIVVSPSADSTFTVIVSSGTCEEDTASVTVSVGTPPNISIAGDTTLCPGQSSTLTASGGTDYQWSSGQTSNAVNISPSQDTTYIVSVSDGGCWETKSISVTILDLPTINITGTNILCMGDTTTLTASGGTSYQWSSGDNTSSVTVNPARDTSYSVQVTDTEGCTNTDTIAISITNPPTVNAGPDQTICTGDNINITAKADGTHYLWSNGDTTLSINVNPITTTTYTITVNKGTCDPVSDEITVNVSSSIKVSAGEDTSICRGGKANLYASGGSQFLWNTGASSQSINVFPATTTTYTVVASSSGGSCPNDTDEVTVNVIQATADAGSGQTINAGQSIILNGSGGGAYVWSPSASLSDTGISNPTANPTITTTYTLTTTTTEGCTAMDFVTIIVGEPCGELFVPNAFSPNGDGINDVLYVRGCVKAINFAIFNRWGEEMFQTNNMKEGWDGRYEDEILNPAVFSYFLQATLESGEEVIQKGNVSLIR